MQDLGKAKVQIGIFTVGGDTVPQLSQMQPHD